VKNSDEVERPNLLFELFLDHLCHVKENQMFVEKCYTYVAYISSLCSNGVNIATKATNANEICENEIV